MAQSWPVALQDRLNTESFQIKKGPTTIRTDMDVGPQKVRRRFTKAVDEYTASITITNDQYPIFESFYNTTLNGGVLAFEYNHPITQVPTDFKFKSDPVYSPMGGEYWMVTFALEAMP